MTHCKVPDVGKDQGQNRREHQRMRWLDGITNAMNMNLGNLWEIVRDGEAYCAVVHGITKSQTWLGNRTTTTTKVIDFFGGSDSKESAYNARELDLFLGWEDPLEKGMATHSSILVWRAPWTEEAGGLQSMGLQRVGHYWGTNTHQDY